VIVFLCSDATSFRRSTILIYFRFFPGQELSSFVVKDVVVLILFCFPSEGQSPFFFSQDGGDLGLKPSYTHAGLPLPVDDFCVPFSMGHFGYPGGLMRLFVLPHGDQANRLSVAMSLLFSTTPPVP